MKVALLLLVTSCFFLDDTSFYDKILTDFKSNNYYVIINVSNKDYKGKVAITSVNLFMYLNQKRKMNEVEFQSFVKQKLINNDTIDISEKGYSSSEFRKILPVSGILKYKQRNKRELVKRYFEPESYISKKEVTEEEETAVIAKLFEWKIATALHSYSGYIMIPHKFAVLLE